MAETKSDYNAYRNEIVALSFIIDTLAEAQRTRRKDKKRGNNKIGRLTMVIDSY